MNLAMQFRPALETEAALLSAIAIDSNAHWPYPAAQLAAWRDELLITPQMVSSLPTFVAEIDCDLAGFFLLRPTAPH